MKNKKYMKQSAIVGALVLSMAVTGCGKKESLRSDHVESSTEQNVAAASQMMQENEDTTDKAVTSKDAASTDKTDTSKDAASTERAESSKDAASTDKSDTSKDAGSTDKAETSKDTATAQKDDSKKDTFYMKAKFDDGEVVLDQNGLSVKDKDGQAIIHDGKIDIKDKDGNFQLNCDGLVIKDEKNGNDTVKINKDGLYVEGDDAVVSWDKDGFKIKSEDANVSFDFSFPHFDDDNDKDDKKSDNKKEASNEEKWEKFADDLGDFISNTISTVHEHTAEFYKNMDWRSWDYVTIMNCNQTINGKTVHTKIWFDDGKLKTMNIPEDNIQLKGFILHEAKDKNGDTIRIYW